MTMRATDLRLPRLLNPFLALSRLRSACAALIERRHLRRLVVQSSEHRLRDIGLTSGDVEAYLDAALDGSLADRARSRSRNW